MVHGRFLRIFLSWLVALLCWQHNVYSPRAEGANSDEWQKTRKSLEPLLRKVADEYKSNQESIRTWQGTVSYELKQSHNGDSSTLRKAVISFAIDIPNQKLFSCYKETEDAGGPAATEIVGCLHEESTKTVYRDISFQPEDITDVEKLRSMKGVLVTTAEHFGFNSSKRNIEIFNPLAWTHVGGPSVPNRFNYYAQFCGEDKEAKNVLIKHAGNLVTLRIGKPESILNEYTVDLNKKSGLVSFISQENNKKSRQWKCELQSVSNVWIPRQIVMVSKSGRITETLDWRDNKVNVPINEEMFSLKNLGVRRGDRGTDLRTQSKYIIEGDEFAPPRDLGMDELKRSSPFKSTFVIIAVVLIILCVVLLVYRRFRRNTQ